MWHLKPKTRWNLEWVGRENGQELSSEHFNRKIPRLGQSGGRKEIDQRDWEEGTGELREKKLWCPGRQMKDTYQSQREWFLIALV